MWVPSRVLIEETALSYPLGRDLHRYFTGLARGPVVSVYRKRIPPRPSGAKERYRLDKSTLVLKVREDLSFQTCKPSAHYQLPLASSCPGMCQYCYLHTSLAGQMYLRAYVNVDEILERAREYIRDGQHRPTVFEGAATSDPLPLERFTSSLRKTIQFFGDEEEGRFRFVTKFADVDGLLHLSHRGHTRFRFSVNAPSVIEKYEGRTASLGERLAAAGKVAGAGYPMGFIIAPIFLEGSYRERYQSLFRELNRAVPRHHDLTFELITHRYTPRAREQIRELFPGTDLPMGGEGRKWKYGQFGYGKYVYDKAQMEEARAFFTDNLARLFPNATIDYFI